MPTKGHKKSVHGNVKDNRSDHLREHLREVHAKIKDYACNQCDSKTVKQTVIQRSGKPASAPQGGARQVPIQVQSV